MRYLVRAYPGQITLLTFLLVISGFAELIGIAALVPLLELGANDPTRDLSALSMAAGDLLRAVGLSPTLGLLLAIIVVALWLKGIFKWLAKIYCWWKTNNRIIT